MYWNVNSKKIQNWFHFDREQLDFQAGIICKMPLLDILVPWLISKEALQVWKTARLLERAENIERKNSDNQ